MTEGAQGEVGGAGKSGKRSVMCKQGNKCDEEGQPRSQCCVDVCCT